jgi:hypothetical protein
MRWNRSRIEQASAVSNSVAQGQQAKAQAAGQDPVRAELERLVEMKQQHLINDDEFTAMKARLLGL